MSARTDAAVARFVSAAKQMVASPDQCPEEIVSLAQQLLNAADQGDEFNKRVLVLQLNDALKLYR